MDNHSVACLGCDAPREKIIGPELPGHTTFSQCEACGELGIKRLGDLYQAPKTKKAFRPCYWERAS
jgi:hypothetical protein